MPLTLAVDAERLLANYLKTQSDVNAIAAGRVFGSLPDAPQFPCITVQRIGGLTRYPHFQDDAQIQVTSWGRTRDEARALARTAHAALKSIPMIHSIGIVLRIVDSLGLSYQPDATYSPARDRYILGVICTTHPL